MKKHLASLNSIKNSKSKLGPVAKSKKKRSRSSNNSSSLVEGSTSLLRTQELGGLRSTYHAKLKPLKSNQGP